jgi:hypothetical protein
MIPPIPGPTTARCGFASLILLSVSLSSCNRLSEKEPITESRELSKYARKPAVDVASAARFYDHEAHQESPQPADPNAPQQHPLVWATPEGWVAKPSTQMRLIDFRFGPQEEGECYLAALPGPAGGLAANINRWRSQIGLDPLTDEEIEKLPRRNFLGGAAHYVVAEGAFKGMGDEASAKQGYSLVGLIHQASELTLFVKMTGPKELVDQNITKFEAFCNSVQFRAKAEKASSN